MACRAADTNIFATGKRVAPVPRGDDPIVGDNVSARAALLLTAQCSCSASALELADSPVLVSCRDHREEY